MWETRAILQRYCRQAPDSLGSPDFYSMCLDVRLMLELYQAIASTTHIVRRVAEVSEEAPAEALPLTLTLQDILVQLQPSKARQRAVSPMALFSALR